MPGKPTDMIGPVERLAHVEGRDARDLHARLRHDELRRRQHDLRLDAALSAQDGGADERVGREAGARGVRAGPAPLRQADDRRRADRRSADDPDLPRHSVGRRSHRRQHEGHEGPAATRLQLGGLRHRPHADGDGGLLGADGRQRPRRARGQSLSRPRRAGVERPARRARHRDRDPHGRARSLTGGGAQEAQAQGA